MADEVGLRVLDGSQIKAALPEVKDRAKKRFEEIDVDRKGVINAEQAKSAAEAEAAVLLLGVKLSSQIFDNALKGVAFPGSESFDQEGWESSLRDYLRAIADALQAEPLVVTVLDGSVIKALLDDEDEFAMLAENLFTELDTDESGKLNRKELRPAILQLGLEQGVPPPTAKPEADELITKLLNKYAADGSEELGQAQFAQLLQEVLQDLSDSLARQPIVIVRDAKVLNGSHLRKILGDPKLLGEITNNLFEDLDTNQDGKLSKTEIRPLFESQGAQWGLPSPDDSEAVEQLYSEVFKEIDTDKSGQLEKGEFKVLAKVIFESFAEQLQLEPILVDLNAAYR